MTEPSRGNVPAQKLHCSVLELLSRYQGELFAVLDAAQDDKILHLCRTASDERRSLYEGVLGEELAEVAPYLLRFDKRSGALEAFVTEGWGKNWGVYLLSDRPFLEIRRHLRRFLTVKTEDGEQLYFRFYDPRVLSVFLPTCDSTQLRDFFGPISRFIVETGTTSLNLFATGSGGLQMTHYEVAAPGRRPAPTEGV